MLDSKERVISTLAFDRPDRIPRDLWGERIIPLQRAEDWNKVQARYPMDFARAPRICGPSRRAKGKPWESEGSIDEWGNAWRSLEEGYSGEVVRPALYKWDNFNAYEMPFDILESPNLAGVNEFCKDNREKYLLGETGPGPFERVQSLLGVEDTFVSLALNEPNLLELIKMVHQWNLRHIETWAQTDIDGITMGDDWGAQASMLISPEAWKRLFRPLYAEYVDLAHSYGKHFLFHSDGYIRDILPDLVDIGIDALNCQLFCMDLEEIASTFQGRITFWGEIDRQQVLPFGTTQEVKATVRRFKRSFHDAQGGVIFQLAWSLADPLENIVSAFDEWDGV